MQYGRYLGRLVQGDLGRSYLQRAEVSELIASRLPASLVLMAAGIAAELVARAEHGDRGGGAGAGGRRTRR